MWYLGSTHTKGCLLGSPPLELSRRYFQPGGSTTPPVAAASASASALDGPAAPEDDDAAAEEDDGPAADVVGFPAVIKPIGMFQSMGVLRVDDLPALEAAYRTVLDELDTARAAAEGTADYRATVATLGVKMVLEEFLDGCLRFHQPATSRHLLAVQCDLRRV